MTVKRFVCYFDNIVKKWCVQDTDSLDMHYVADKLMGEEFAHLLNLYHQTLDNVEKENAQLKKELNKLKKFEQGGEHIRLSINIETGELQRHIYATGQWFGDFDRVLVDNWLSKEDYQRFINRVIEVYNTEFKKELDWNG